MRSDQLRGDSPEVPFDVLPRRITDQQEAHFVEGQSDFDALNSGRPVFQYCIYGVLGLLLAELTAQVLFRRLANVQTR